MADASTSRRWQVFLVLGLIACVASLYFLIGGGTFAAISGLVTLSIALLNAFLSPATAKTGENWFVGAMKRTLVVGRYAKVLCIALWIVALISAGVLARVAYEKRFKADIEGLVIDELRGTPVEKAFVNLRLADGASLSTDAPAGRFKFTALDRRKAALGKTYLEANCEGVRGRVPVDFSKGSVKNVRIVLPVSMPPTKRMFFVLKGHTVDILVRDKKLPAEFEAKLGGNIALIDTPPFRELCSLMDKFSTRVGEDLPEEGLTDESDNRKSMDASEEIRKEQWERLTKGRVLPAAAGTQGVTNKEFDATKLPASFFTNGSWSIDVQGLDELLAEKHHAKSGDPTSLEIPISIYTTRFEKFATRADLEALQAQLRPDHDKIRPDERAHSAGIRDPSLRRTNEEMDKALEALSEYISRSEDKMVRFLEYISRNGMPPNFLWLSAGSGCGDSPELLMKAPALQLRVVVLENITDKPVELGKFHFRMAVPAVGERSVRTAQENAVSLAALNPKSESWYAPGVLKPGEKVIVPLELELSFAKWDQSGSDPDEKQREEERLAECSKAEAMLRARSEIQRVVIVTNAGSKRPPFASMQKQTFMDGLLRKPPRITDDLFVYGPSVAVEAIDVNGAPYVIEPFNPAYVSYLSGEGMGSCPFVYCHRGAGHGWLRQGSILRGRKSKAREGTGELWVHGFDGTLRITEEEAEIAYIDELFVSARSATGESVTLRPVDERLGHKDGRYVVLKKGESIEVKFAIPSGVPGDQVRVNASGYFEPTSPLRGR